LDIAPQKHRLVDSSCNPDLDDETIAAEMNHSQIILPD